MDDGQKAKQRVRRQYLSVGIPLVSVGSSLQIVVGNVHEFIPQMIVRGISILMVTGGIIIMVRGIAKAKKAKEANGN